MLSAFNRVAECGELQKVWALPLNPVPIAGNTDSPNGIYSLAFSPDGKQIAVIVGRSQRDQELMVLDVQTPQVDDLHFHADARILEWEGGEKSVQWSPSGQYLALGNTIVNLKGGSSCTLPGAGQWVGPERVIALNARHLSLFDRECRETGVWKQFNDDQVIEYFAVSEVGDKILLTQSTIRDFTKDETSTFIAEINTGRVLRRSTWRLTARTTSETDGIVPLEAKFADSDKALCGRRGPYWGGSVECSTPGNGSVLGVTTGWNAPNLRPALASSRIVISDYSKRFDFIDFRWYLGPLRKRVVWDFRTRQEIVRWKPKAQELQRIFGSTNSDIRATEPYRFDISPDGEFVVEGGAGVVTLYRIKP